MLFMNNECTETDIQKANMLNNYFASQATLDDDNRPLPHFTPVQHHLAGPSPRIKKWSGGGNHRVPKRGVRGSPPRKF